MITADSIVTMAEEMIGASYDIASVIESTARPTVTDPDRVGRSPADARHTTAESETQKTASAGVPPRRDADE